MPRYNVLDWYWAIDGDGSRVFSSRRRLYVPIDDSEFKAWGADGTVPTRIDSEASLAEVLSPHGIPLGAAGLKDAVVSAALAACDGVSTHLNPDATHQNAYTNAATIVWASGGKAPTVDPAKSVFAAQGASVGIADPDTFAQVVTAVSLGSMELATILNTLKGAVDKADTTEDLAAGLLAFETSLAAFVKGLNGAGLTVSVAAPDAIIIPGVND